MGLAYIPRYIYIYTCIIPFLYIGYYIPSMLTPYYIAYCIAYSIPSMLTPYIRIALPWARVDPWHGSCHWYA